MTDQPTLSIVDFLNARLADDEAAAENASQDPDEGNVWSVGARQGTWKQEARIGDDREDLVFDIKDGVCVDFDDLLAYLVRFHPARVLREVAAKRRIMERHSLSEASSITAYCEGCPGDEIGYPVVELNDCPELRDLAAVYSDHPDYREEWAA